MIRLNILRNLIRTWREHTGMQLATLTVLTGTFTVVTLFFFLHSNMTRILTNWGQDVQLAVFLKDEASGEAVKRIEEFLRGLPGLGEIKYVSKESAAELFQKQMGHYSPQLLTDPEFGNPLPASFEIRFAEGIHSESTYNEMVKTAKKIAALIGVEDVSYGQGWIENYAAVLKVFSSSSYLLILILLAGSLLVVGNAIRNAISQRREEIEVLELVGATAFHIRLPYLIEGAVLGGLAALFSLVFCYFIFRWQQNVAAAHLGFWGLASEVKFLDHIQIVSIFSLGVLFGTLGSYVCVRRIASGWAAAERR